MQSIITIATNDHTTAFVVAIPTPFAPPFASYPQLELIRLIAPPKHEAIFKTNHNLPINSYVFKTRKRVF